MSLPASAFVEGSLAHRFRALWDNAAEDGEEWPDVFAWLAGHPSAAPSEMVDVLLVDFHNRFRREGPLPPERYLDAFPAVARDPDLVMQLVGGELQARRDRGELVDVARFASRFPRWREGIIGWFAPAAKGKGRDAEFGAEVPAQKGAEAPLPLRKRVPVLGWLALGVLLVAGAGQGWLAIQARGYERMAATPLDIQVIAPDGWLAGSRAALGLRTLDGATGDPRPGVPLRVSLLGGGGEELAKAEVPGDEAAGPVRWVPIEVPDSPGRKSLRVLAAADGGGEPEVVEVPVVVRRAGKLMISADKPIYRPGEAIRLRGLALREPDLRPIAGGSATFRVLDPKGNVIYRGEGPTSRHGIASAECPLAAEAMTGDYLLRLAVGELEGEAKVRVEPYELPKIEVVLAPDKAAVPPGAPISGTVRARYLFGKPVAGAKVRIWSPAGGEAVEVQTGEDGSARFEWPGLPPSGDAANLELLARVEDSAGQRQDVRAFVATSAGGLRLEIWSDGEFVPGLSNIVYARTTRPDGRPAAANVVATGGRAIAAGADGLATFELTEIPATGLFLKATAEDGASAQATFLPPPPASAAKLLVDRVLVTAGEPVAATLRRAGDAPPEAVSVEAVRDGQVIAAASLGAVREEASATLAIPEGISGRVTLVARAWGGAPIASRPIEVLSPRRLSIKASWDRPEYRPGEPARLQFLVADAEGRPAPGALSVAMVDRAVELALKSAGAEAPPAIGRELAYFRPDALGDPGGDPDGRERLARAELSRPGAASPMLASAAQVVSLYSKKSAAVEAERSAGLGRVELRSRQLKYALGVALAALASVAAILWVCSLRPAIRNAVFASAATAILLLIGFMFTSVQVEYAASTAGSALEAAKGEAMPPPMSEAPMLFGAGAERGGLEPRLRKDFPETLLWRPELVTDDRGHASIELGLADSITTWKLMAGAVSAEGGLGGMESELRVFQPFQVDLNLPRTLTRGDRIDVPVVVYNFLDRPQVVSVTLGGDGPGRAARAVELGPNEVRSVSYPLRVERVGKIALRAEGVAQDASDAIERTVEVVPDGRLVEQLANGILREPAAFDFAVPPDAVPGSAKLLVKLYPTAFSQAMDGLEGIFAMPHGCFEQTSATTYPNLLALDYLKRTETARPDIEAKARGYVHLGYQRLLTFEVEGGGFDWFGRAPANRVLTAYGLMEFRDMARVADVDPKLIERTRDWLMRQRRPDGSWEPESHGIREGVNTYTDGDQAPLRATAYIAWSIWDGDPSPGDAGPTLAYLTKAPAESLDDPYTLALMANALLAMDPSGDSARPYVRRLSAIRKPAGKAGAGGAPWEAPAPAPGGGNGRTVFLGAGDSRAVETAALAALALIRAKEDAGAAAEALEWLVARRGSGGTWASTQATVLALKALLVGTGAPLGDGVRAVELALDDAAPRRIEIPAGQSDVVKAIDLGGDFSPGQHRLALADVGGGGTTYQVIFRHNAPEGGTDAQQGPDPLRIDLAYGKTDLKVFEEVTAKARVENPSDAPAPMAIARLPMPPGFALEGVEAPPEVERTETAPDAVTLYLRELSPGKAVEVSYRLRPTMPMAVAVPPARVYEYYDPERGGSGGAARLVVAE